MKLITDLNGKGAMFVKGYMDAFYSGTRKLRDLQEAGKLLIEDEGGEVSVPYMSKLSRMLVEAKIVTRDKEGRSYVSAPGKYAEEFQEFLATHEMWGTTLKGTWDDAVDKMTILEELEERGAVRGDYEHRIPRAAYKLLQAKVMAGELDIMFVKPGVDVATVGYNGKNRRIHSHD